MMFYLEQFFWLVSGGAVGGMSSAFLLHFLWVLFNDMTKPRGAFDRHDGCTGYLFAFGFFIGFAQLLTPPMPTRSLEMLEKCDWWTDRAWERTEPYGDQFSGYHVCEKITEYVQPCLEWEEVSLGEDRFGQEYSTAYCWEYGEGKWETTWLKPEEIEEQIFDLTYNWARFVVFWILSLFSIGYFFGNIRDKQTADKISPPK